MLSVSKDKIHDVLIVSQIRWKYLKHDIQSCRWKKINRI